MRKLPFPRHSRHTEVWPIGSFQAAVPLGDKNERMKEIWRNTSGCISGDYSYTSFNISLFLLGYNLICIVTELSAHAGVT